LVSAGSIDVFIAKLNAVGNEIWAQRFGHSNSQIAKCTAVDDWNSVVIGGVFHDSVDFGGGNLVSAGGQDIFLAKFAP